MMIQNCNPPIIQKYKNNDGESQIWDLSVKMTQLMTKVMNGETLHTFSNVLYILLMSLNFKIVVLKTIISIVLVILDCEFKTFRVLYTDVFVY